MAPNDEQRLTDFCGLRPMEPERDLRSVVQLIREGFDPWQSWRGRSFLSLLEIMSYTGPLLSLLRFSSAFRQFCSAIVWVEDGQVVGVVAGHAIGHDPRFWIFKNIVVSKLYRGRGIGRGLQRGLIDKALREGAEKAIVMIRVDNAASLNLASSDGFHPLTVTTYMALTHLQTEVPAFRSMNGLRPHKRKDWPQVYELKRTVIPPELRPFNPGNESDFSKKSDDILGSGPWDLIRGQRVHRFVVKKNGELAATLKVEACLWAEHRLEIIIHPRWRGRVEEVLVGKALNVLTRYPKKPISIRVPAAYTQAIEVLRRYGFEEKKTQAILGMDLRHIRDQAAGESARSL